MNKPIDILQIAGELKSQAKLRVIQIGAMNANAASEAMFVEALTDAAIANADFAEAERIMIELRND